MTDFHLQQFNFHQFKSNVKRRMKYSFQKPEVVKVFEIIDN